MKTTEQRIAEVNEKAAAEIERIKLDAERKAKQIAERNAANAAARKATEECRARVEKEHGMENHPKRDLLWAKAWEHGHSAGLDDVDTWYSDLVELVK